jgi:hypothetical protein
MRRKESSEPMTIERDTAWSAAIERHGASVRDYLSTAEAVDEAAWSTPIGGGKWTPAQITVHLIQTYEVLLRQLRTGEGLRVQTGWLLRQVLRIVVLGPIMMTGRIPPGARAPRDLQPGAVEVTREEGVARLRTAVSEFESELMARRDEPGLQLTHHIFGSVEALRAIDFVRIHTEHHGRQLPVARGQ